MKKLTLVPSPDVETEGNETVVLTIAPGGAAYTVDPIAAAAQATIKAAGTSASRTNGARGDVGRGRPGAAAMSRTLACEGAAIGERGA